MIGLQCAGECFRGEANVSDEIRSYFEKKKSEHAAALSTEQDKRAEHERRRNEIGIAFRERLRDVAIPVIEEATKSLGEELLLQHGSTGESGNDPLPLSVYLVATLPMNRRQSMRYEISVAGTSALVRVSDSQKGSEGIERPRSTEALEAPEDITRDLVLNLIKRAIDDLYSSSGNQQK